MNKILLINSLFLFCINCFLVSPKEKKSEKEIQNLINIINANEILSRLGKKNRVNFFSSDIGKLEIQILYQNGSEPFTEKISPMNAQEVVPWQILEENLTTVFS
ncbi:MAG: hypothetical protein IPL26_03915 [Leptospiraceae bacterium]|nr:hypothetical protein [Leptospiraceae bacterium]